MWWKILLVILVLYLILRLFTFLFGNWRATLNRVITQYIAWKQMEPEYSDEQIFIAVLDHHYPEKTGLMSKMHDRKDEIKGVIKMAIENKVDIVYRYNLPILIYSCLLIENNSYLNSKKNIQESLGPIIEEVKRQGFSQYC